jgi:hypothetical protein
MESGQERCVNGMLIAGILVSYAIRRLLVSCAPMGAPPHCYEFDCSALDAKSIMYLAHRMSIVHRILCANYRYAAMYHYPVKCLINQLTF